MEVLIDKPDIKVIKTPPSSIGRVDYFMVLCEREVSETHFNSNSYDDMGIWEDNSESVIAIYVDDDDFNLPIYILHATASDRAEPAQFIPELENNTDFSAKNVTYFDSVLTHHCITAKHSDELIYLKTGFHYSAVEYDLSTSRSKIRYIDEGDYKEIAVNYDVFRDVYERAQAIWLKIKRNT